MSKRAPIKPRKSPTQARAQGTVDAILQATAQVLVKDGYEAFSTNRVAERAGVSIGSLYQYFPNKTALLAALIDRHIDDGERLIQGALADLVDEPLEVAVPRMIQLMIELHRQDPKLHRALFDQLPGSAYLPKRDRLEAQIRALAEGYFLAQGLLPEKVALQSFITVTVVESLTHLAVITAPEYLADPEFEAEVSRLLLGFLRGAARERPGFSKRSAHRAQRG